jgi:hypothetical protein
VYPNLIQDLSIESRESVLGSGSDVCAQACGICLLGLPSGRLLPKCIGWSLSRTMESSLPLQALEMALAGRQVTAGLIHHVFPREAVL